MNCTNDCNTCESLCNKACPLCKKVGIIVPTDTVISLTKEEKIHYSANYYLCTNPLCDVAYFSDEGVINKDKLKVDLWFKKGFKKRYMICYCRDIDLNDVIKAVENLDDINISNIIKYLNKENITTNCLINNPLGKDCEQLFNNAIEYALRIKEQKR